MKTVLMKIWSKKGDRPDFDLSEFGKLGSVWKYSFIVFASVLAYIIGTRLSLATMTILMGVGIDLLASIPTVILLAILNRPQTTYLPSTKYQRNPPAFTMEETYWENDWERIEYKRLPAPSPKLLEGRNRD